MKSRFANMDICTLQKQISYHHNVLDLQLYAILRMLVLPIWHKGHLQRWCQNRLKDLLKDQLIPRFFWFRENCSSVVPMSVSSMSSMFQMFLLLICLLSIFHICLFVNMFSTALEHPVHKQLLFSPKRFSSLKYVTTFFLNFLPRLISYTLNVSPNVN